jgi:hypothetical protein
MAQAMAIWVRIGWPSSSPTVAIRTAPNKILIRGAFFFSLQAARSLILAVLMQDNC